MVRIVGVKVKNSGEGIRSTFLGASLVLVFFLLVGTVSAQVASDTRSGTMGGRLLTPRIPSGLQGIPYLNSFEQYLKNARLTFYLGKLHSMARHFRYELESTGATVPLIRHVNYIHAQYGIWLGAALEAPLSDGIGLHAEGWKLLPSRRNAYGSYFHNSNPPAPGDLPDSMNFWREWSPNTNAWYADLFLTVSPGLDGYVNGIWAVCGGRYDSYRRVLSHSLSRGNANGVQIASNADEMEMTVQLLIPYIGVQVSRAAPRYDLAVRMIGTPIVIGGLKHEETFGGIAARDEGWFPFEVPRGYWAELFVEGGLRVTQQITLGGFLKMTTMTFVSNADITRHSMTGGPTQSENYDLIYRRLMYTYGAKAALHF